MGGGAIFAPFKGISRGLADPEIIHMQLPAETPSNMCNCDYENCNMDLDSINSLNNREENAAKGYFGNFFGPVPTQVEVEKAMFDLQKFMHGLSESELNLPQQETYLYDTKMLQFSGYRRFCDAFRMLETEPSVQNMVFSLSCDKAIWEAIKKNEAVRNLEGSLLTAKEGKSESSKEEKDIANLVLKWIMGITKTKIVDLIEKFCQLVYEIFQTTEKEKPTSELSDLVEEKLRSSVLLSLVILMIVIVTRNYGA